MASIIELNQEAELTPSSAFPYVKFNFDKFNPVQSAILKVYESRNNCLVSSNTSSGKTAIALMFLIDEIKKNKGKGIYLSPLKALSQEKLDEWQSGLLSEFKISICTGDYVITSERKKELAEADIIIMTYEILNSISRSMSEKSAFLEGNITLAVDEAHNLSLPTRGDHLEVGLINFLKVNPKARIVALSATLPNYKEIGEWIAKLTDRDTFVLYSDYRPCKLLKYYEKVPDRRMRYKDKENKKIDYALDIIKQHSDDKFIIFAHSKTTGNLMLERLLRHGIQADFHNADMTKVERLKLEKEFRESNKLNVLVATSTLEAGINMPADRVIVLGVHRGISEVDVNSINQQCGRAGRPQYCDKGFAHVLLPESNFEDWVFKIKNPPDILSALITEDGDCKNLAFHVVSEIHHGFIKNKQDLYDWFKHTLAYHQDQELDGKFIDDMIKGLVKLSILKEDNGSYVLTSLGKISSLFYFSPYDVASLYFNFDKLFKNSLEKDDFRLANALADIDTHRSGIASAAELEECEQFKYAMIKRSINCENNSVLKIGFAYHSLLTGLDNSLLSNLLNKLRMDSGRLIEVLAAIDSMAGKWNKGKWWNKLKIRINYGVPWNMVEICSLPGIGHVKTKKLYEAGLTCLQDIAKSPSKVKLVLKCSEDVANEISKNAMELLLVG